MRKSVGTEDGFFQLVTINRAYGVVGYVRLRDADPHSPLIINPRYLQNSYDGKALVEGNSYFKAISKLFLIIICAGIPFSVDLVERTRAFKEIGGRLFPVTFPGCEGFPFSSDKYYELAKQARPWTGTLK